MTIDYTTLVERERELEKKRSVCLARQQWATVIELEARIDECKLWRKRMSDAEQKVADGVRIGHVVANATPEQLENLKRLTEGPLV